MTDVHNPATILVVEDEAILRLWLAQALEQNGFHVLEAGSRNAAVEILNGASDVDLVFTDIRMPGTIDGVALMRWVRKERPELKVIISSAVRIDGADATVVKPYSMNRVVESIRGLLTMPLQFTLQ
jgi:two-component system, response regulator PdtaR